MSCVCHKSHCWFLHGSPRHRLGKGSQGPRLKFSRRWFHACVLSFANVERMSFVAVVVKAVCDGSEKNGQTSKTSEMSNSVGWEISRVCGIAVGSPAFVMERQ